MFAPSRRFLTYACCAAASLSLAGFRAAPATTGHTAGTPNHFNVGATHSPQLLRQLARPGRTGGPGAAGARRAAQPRWRRRAGRGRRFLQHPGGAAIDWSQVAASGIGFAAVKATEGAYYQQPLRADRLAQARAAGLSVVAYAFAIPNGNGASSSPPPRPTTLLSTWVMSRSVPVMLDIEYNPYGRECYGLTATAMVSWISSFNYEVKAKTGQKPIMYVPVILVGTAPAAVQDSAKRQLWVPDYPRTQPAAACRVEYLVQFWQYTSTGTVRGIPAPGHTDLDRANPAIPPVLGNQ